MTNTSSLSHHLVANILMPDNTPKSSRKIIVEDKKKDKINSPDSAPPAGSFSPQWLWTGRHDDSESANIDIDHTLLQTERVLESSQSVGDQKQNQPVRDEIGIEHGEHPWTAVLRTPCDFEPQFLLTVMENLLRNPNVTSSSLFRADILYDSVQDKDGWDEPDREGGFVKWMRKDLQPRKITVDQSTGLKLKRTVVRKLVPRKPWVDPELCQTVHFLDNYLDSDDKTRKNVVLYIPHVDSKDKIPFYHPQVRALALRHFYTPDSSPSGSLEVFYQLFSSTDMDSQRDSEGSHTSSQDSSAANRLQRTALNFLRIVHKHATGQKAGYTKRVHHDLVVPQKRFQDTYTALKAKYSQSLMDTWAEVTDPLKHVFEDLGIAAFLIEVWRDVYDLPLRNKGGRFTGDGLKLKGNSKSDKSPFPGFVDVGCGNGVLVYILKSEGFNGWGFDARNRKSWEVFPKDVQECLQQRILIPEPFVKEVEDHEILRNRTPSQESAETQTQNFKAEESNKALPKTHNGVFEKGTFIISNHADQLTIWTPLMAYLSDCPFIAIPCCSHGIFGKLQRFYDTPPGTEEKPSQPDNRTKGRMETDNEKSPNDIEAANKLISDHDNDNFIDEALHNTTKSSTSSSTSKKHTPEKGSLVPRKPGGPSAYAGFSAHVMHIALDLGFDVRQEILRIPSTRNLCVLGLNTSTNSSNGTDVTKEEVIAKLLQKEVDGDVNKAARDWMDEAMGLIKPKQQKRRDAHTFSDSKSAENSNKQMLQKGYQTVLGLDNLEDWEMDLLRPS